MLHSITYTHAEGYAEDGDRGREEQLTSEYLNSKYLWTKTQQYPLLVTDMVNDPKVTRCKNDKN